MVTPPKQFWVVLPLRIKQEDKKGDKTIGTNPVIDVGEIRQLEYGHKETD
ncbi:hypothetical protein GCM10007895_33840 [Paraferrimonas sedimenticola]|uniref:Uncharacterized protein n=1 Tax=Paraferrimonas sedimenticola TaxID=375674 RepID=A0AA37S073_9GAMM|nr:hypothetical protein GCM10007895_33840 [Paraferrimonas sedimenticola]